jgi:hypothetical protein
VAQRAERRTGLAQLLRVQAQQGWMLDPGLQGNAESLAYR